MRGETSVCLGCARKARRGIKQSDAFRERKLESRGPAFRTGNDAGDPQGSGPKGIG